MLDFLKKCARYILGEQSPQQSVPKAHIWSSDETSVDFCVTDFHGEEALISVPRDQISHSSFVQQYALEGTVVVDIKTRPEHQKYFGSPFPEFDITLDTGDVYTVGPIIKRTP